MLYSFPCNSFQSVFFKHIPTIDVTKQIIIIGYILTLIDENKIGYFSHLYSRILYTTASHILIGFHVYCKHGLYIAASSLKG